MTTNMEQTVIEILNGVNNNVQQQVMEEQHADQKDLKVENKKTNI